MPVRRPQVIDAALALLDEVGLDGLTTRALAERLGVRVGALYWHVASKQELLNAVADRIAEELIAGEQPTGSWTERLRAYADRLRSVMLAHRDGARLIVAAPMAMSRHTLAFADRLMGVLRDGGSTLATAAYGADVVFSYVTGFVLQEQAMTQLEVNEAKLQQVLASVTPEELPHFAEWAPHLGLGRTRPFDAGLTILIAGLDAAIRTDQAVDSPA